MNKVNKQSRREFLQSSAVISAGIVISGGLSEQNLFGQEDSGNTRFKRTATKGYAARDASGKLSPWTFARRPLGEQDVLIDIKYSGICHSDIHQLRGEWGPQKYPQVPGHEIAGVVSAVGRNVRKFKVGDHAGVGCMVDSCGTCPSCSHGEEQHCDKGATVFTYGYPEPTSPTGISQGGYANNIVVKERFAVPIPKTIRLQDAATLLCAGITTYSPLMKALITKGVKVGVAGIGGLGHLAIMLAVSKGAEVYAFTTSATKVNDIRKFGAKEVVVVDSPAMLKPYSKVLDYMISTIPVNYDAAAYASMVKPYGDFVQVGMPAKGEVTINNFEMNRNRVKYSTSLIGGIPQTEEVIKYCAQNSILPQIQLIKASEVNDAWDKVINKEARYRYVIDAATF